MNKKEKYYKFIVDDMISKTEIGMVAHGDIITINHPSFYIPFYVDKSDITTAYETYSRNFVEYCFTRYGTSRDECATLWRMYIDMSVSTFI